MTNNYFIRETGDGRREAVGGGQWAVGGRGFPSAFSLLPIAFSETLSES